MIIFHDIVINQLVEVRTHICSFAICFAAFHNVSKYLLLLISDCVRDWFNK